MPANATTLGMGTNVIDPPKEPNAYESCMSQSGDDHASVELSRTSVHLPGSIGTAC